MTTVGLRPAPQERRSGKGAAPCARSTATVRGGTRETDGSGCDRRGEHRRQREIARPLAKHHANLDQMVNCCAKSPSRGA
jgi:hypothetical protein